MSDKVTSVELARDRHVAHLAPTLQAEKKQFKFFLFFNFYLRTTLKNYVEILKLMDQVCKKNSLRRKGKTGF